MMNWKECGRKGSLLCLRYCPSIYWRVEEATKTPVKIADP
jgi:hypothetical protein